MLPPARGRLGRGGPGRGGRCQPAARRRLSPSPAGEGCSPRCPQPGRTRPWRVRLPSGRARQVTVTSVCCRCVVLSLRGGGSQVPGAWVLGTVRCRAGTSCWDAGSEGERRARPRSPARLPLWAYMESFVRAPRRRILRDAKRNGRGTGASRHRRGRQVCQTWVCASTRARPTRAVGVGCAASWARAQADLPVSERPTVLGIAAVAQRQT